MRKNIPVSPRRNPKNRAKSKNEREEKPSNESIEERDDGIYIVRKITGATSNKSYRCPGCDQVIPTATPHTVAWLEEDVDSRRHWHSVCWKNKDNRKPRILKSKSAPRY